LTRRRLLLALISLATGLRPFSLASGADAQQPNRVPVVGYLAQATGPDDPLTMAWRQGLRELGYVEGRTIRVEFRTAQGHPDRLPGLAEELVQLNVDVIFTGSTLGAQALKRTTSTIPIVMALVTDPVGSGLVASLAHPGGNVTGLSSITTELSSKRLQLLKEAIPRLARVAVMWNPDTPLTPWQAKAVEDLNAAAASMSIHLNFVRARAPSDFDAAFSAMRQARAQALHVIENPAFYANRMTLAMLASKARLPTISGTRAFADAGALMSYGVDYADQMRRAAEYIDKILKGAKPGDLPIEQPTKFELVVNLKTAKALGITIPESILVRADEVIK
jgi:putative ABC transport system substrate-binding protein